MMSISNIYGGIERRVRCAVLPMRLSLANQVAKSSPPYGKPVVLLGNGRSGTSWIGSTLGFAPRSAYYREPCHPHSSLRNDDSVWSRYIEPEGDDPHFRNCLQRVFAGGFVGVKDLSVDAIDTRRRGLYRIIVKEVATFLSIEWLYLKWNPEIVVVTRHPCPYVLSVRKMGIETPERRRFSELIGNPKLADGVLSNCIGKLEKLTDDVEISAAIWGIKNAVAFEAKSRYPEWRFISYEDFCRDPISEFRALYKSLDLEWTKRVEEHIHMSTTHHSPGIHSVEKVSPNQIVKWRNEIESDELRRIRKVIDYFELPIYRDDEDWKV